MNLFAFFSDTAMTDEFLLSLYTDLYQGCCINITNSDQVDSFPVATLVALIHLWVKFNAGRKENCFLHENKDVIVRDCVLRCFKMLGLLTETELQD